MPSTSEYRSYLSKGGSARRALSDVWGSNYADEFCNGLLLRLIQPEDNMKIHLWASRDGTFQVNIDKGNSRAYTNEITSDPLAVIGEYLAPELVCSSDTFEDGTGGTRES